MQILKACTWKGRLLDKSGATCLRELDVKELAALMTRDIVVDPIRVVRRRSWRDTVIEVMMVPMMVPIVMMMMPTMHAEVEVHVLTLIHGQIPVVAHGHAAHQHANRSESEDQGATRSHDARDQRGERGHTRPWKPGAVFGRLAIV